MMEIETDKIRDRAYALWEQAGGPEGEDDRFWIQAERELSEEAGFDTSAQAATVNQPTSPAGTMTH